MDDNNILEHRNNTLGGTTMDLRAFVDVWNVSLPNGECAGWVEEQDYSPWWESVANLVPPLRGEHYTLSSVDRNALCPFGTKDPVQYNFVCTRGLHTGELLCYVRAIRATAL